MAEELLVNQVRSQTIAGVPGRSLNSARTNHFVIDEPPAYGGPGEAITPAEAFLAGVAACGVLLVQTFARQDGLPLARAEASIEGVRLAADPTTFREIHLRFVIAGIDRQRAESLVERFKGR